MPTGKLTGTKTAKKPPKKQPGGGSAADAKKLQACARAILTHVEDSVRYNAEVTKLLKQCMSALRNVEREAFQGTGRQDLCIGNIPVPVPPRPRPGVLPKLKKIADGLS